MPPSRSPPVSANRPSWPLRPARCWPSRRISLRRPPRTWPGSARYVTSRASAVEKIKRKGDTSATAMSELEGAVEDLEKTVVPAMPRLLADDSTPEAMARLMGEQGGRLGVLSAEGGLFSTLAGRYASGVPNLDLVLKAWSGDFCRVDRISRETVTLTEPVLSIGLAIQPDILASLAEAKHFRGAGLLARFLYSLPTSLVGTRKAEPAAVPEAVSAAYGAAVDALARAVRASARTTEMKLADEARATLNAFRESMEPRLHPEGGDLAEIADWANSFLGSLCASRHCSRCSTTPKRLMSTRTRCGRPLRSRPT